MIDWQQIRSQFPVTEHSVYLNTAGAGPLPRATMEAAANYYRQMSSEGDVHWHEWLAQRDEVRKKVAAFINAEPDEVALTINTSSGINVIIDALENHGEVISCDLEFPVSTLPWMNRRIPIHLLKSVAGRVKPEDIRAAMNVRTGVICLSHVQFSNGFRGNIEALAAVKGGHALVINASQSAGAFAIDVKRMQIDALCATGHKWMLAGYGSGFVYISRALMHHSKPRAIGWLSLQDQDAMRNDEAHLRHDAAARAELGCPHFAGIFALGASVDLMTQIGIENIEQRVLELNRYLTERLSAAGWQVLSPLDDEDCRSAETLVAATNPTRLVQQLAEEKIIVTEKPQGFRVATHFFNNESDVDRLLDGLAHVNDLQG